MPSTNGSSWRARRDAFSFPPLQLLSFFFSSRRRHTRLQGDWSSDVCSSDLSQRRSQVDDVDLRVATECEQQLIQPRVRSEERRVGKECRCRWWREQEKKNGERGATGSRGSS